MDIGSAIVIVKFDGVLDIGKGLKGHAIAADPNKTGLLAGAGELAGEVRAGAKTKEVDRSVAVGT